MSHETLNLNADAAVEEAIVAAVVARAAEEAVEGPPDPVPHDPGDPIDLTESQALDRLEQGLEFAAEDDVTVHAEGTDLSIDVDDLDDLGIDHVAADTSTIGDDIVHDQGDVLMDLGLDTIDTSKDPAADMLALLESFDEPIFVDAANAGISFTRDESNAFNAASDQVQDDIAKLLVDLGVDYVNVIGTEDPDDAPV